MSAARTGYRPELDGIRTICILFTLAHHLPGKPWLINGSVGVDIFFALSGWLITWLLIHDAHDGKGVKLASYYIRRVFRIVPLYALTVVLYGLAALAIGFLTGEDTDIVNFRSSFLYFVTFNGEYIPHESGNLFGHSWTLGIEEKFYIIWPLVMVFLWNSPLIAGVALVSALLPLVWIDPSVMRGYGGLGFGAALAVAASRSETFAAWLRSQKTAWLALAGMAGAYIGSLASPYHFLWMVWSLAIAFFAAGLIGSLWLGERGLLGKILSWRPLAAAGRLTYALYLTHVLAMNAVLLVLAKLHVALPWLALFAISYVASIAVAYVLHRLVEKPFIETGRKLAKRVAANRVVAPARAAQALTGP